MPILNVVVSAKRSKELTESIVATLSELTATILGKKPEVTSILVNYVDPDDWYVGGKSLTSQGKSSVYFDIKITDETNTKSEKARYIESAFHALGKLLGNLHNESYIYVEDVRGSSYGYGGKTQEYRAHH